jgi:mannitol-1-/sugar-/sorbitol-6-/2-deoxyglucose-6-phosphatase
VLQVAIFDMDGLLIDSEPLWRRAERAVFAELGVELTEAMCERTTGLRIDEVVRHWHGQFGPWAGATADDVARRVIERVIALIRDGGEPKPGAREAVAAAREAGLRLALASSSARPIIDAALARLGLEATFEAVHSASVEALGKPHPAVYLSTAARLGAAPSECVALEDSLPGVIAAKAARMTCIAVPDVAPDRLAPFAVADVVLRSLLDVTPALLRGLAEGHGTGST